MCIGKSGCVIREMQQRTQTRIQIPSQPTPGQIFRLATVTGPAEGCQKIQEIIARISNEQSSQFVMTGECFNQYGQQQAYGQHNNQQQYGSAAAGGGGGGGGGQQGGDYSAQWAAYYAAQDGAKGGGASGAQQSASTGAPTTGAAAGGASSGSADQYYEDFFRYSYHYGEEAARKAYSAWSPPEGTPNPYGANPNASAAPASAPTPSPAAAAPRQHRDSSVRSVSNLPAWMTKS